jgi:hypothetical protein
MLGGNRILRMIQRDGEDGFILGGWVDHHRVSGDCFISEPYSLYVEKFNLMLEFCKRHNLEWMIDGQSKHNPGQCIRIMIREVGGKWEGYAS